MSQAYQRFLAEAAPRSAAQRVWTPTDGSLPALYLGHGAPPLLDDAVWMRQLFDWALSMPKPKAILVISAHWEHAPLSISSTAAGTPLVYDFGGFEPRFYRMTYPTPDASALGRRIAALMPDTVGVHEHRRRGLDHGAWVPLKAMYPNADVPVVQLSLPTQHPDGLLKLGRRLAELRREGVLIIGSGFMTHGLPFLRRVDVLGQAPPPAWSVDFDAWAADALARGDIDTLAAFQDRAPGMPYAHPTVDHYIPLFVTLGAADNPESSVTTTIEGYFMGLSKRSFQVA